jgi:hypothetical protein
MGNRMTVPAYQCQTGADCAGSQACVLNRCVGNCQSATTCPAGQGCSMAVCGVCSLDSSCRAGEVCNGGVCYACDRGTNPNCCSASADCGAGNGCVQGLCRAVPNPLGTNSWLKPIGTGSTTSVYTQVSGTDGTLYAFDVSAPPVLRAWAPDGTPLWTSPAAPGALYLTDLPMVVRVGTQDVLFVSSNTSNIFYVAGVGPTGFGGWKTLNTFSTVGTISVPAMAQGVTNAPGSAKPAVFMSSQGHLFAVDPQAALAGTFSVFWQQPNTGCAEPSTMGGSWVLVGSDGTVYHVCNDGSVQAWSPDGLATQPVGATRPGSLLWTSTPAVAFPSSPAMHPALGKVPSSSTDVLYLSQGSAASSSVLRVSASGLASRTEVPVSGLYGFLVDAQGNGLALSSQTANLNILSPTGAVLGGSSGTYAFSGQNNVLTSDGLLWFVDSKNSPATLAAVQVSAPSVPTLAFRVAGPGNLPWDASAWLTFVPQALTGAVGTAMLVLDDNLSSLGYPSSRMLVGFPSASGAATLSQWSTQGGDPQHRDSLKTQ